MNWPIYMLYFVLGGSLVTAVRVLSSRQGGGWLVGILIAMPVITTLSYIVLVLKDSSRPDSPVVFETTRSAIKSNLILGLPGFVVFLFVLYALLPVAKTRWQGLACVAASAAACTLFVLIGSRFYKS